MDSLRCWGAQKFSIPDVHFPSLEFLLKWGERERERESEMPPGVVCVCLCVATALLKLCDVLRDSQLPELGVLLEDKDGQTVVKYVGKEAALRERDNARKVRRRSSL